MCPEHQILSVYLDGELPPPWKEKLENHLGRCAPCRERLESYRNMSRALGAGDPAGEDRETAALGTVLEQAKERVWLKLQAPAETAASRGPGLWSRSVSVPFPLAAAAALLVIALGLFAFRQFFFTVPAQDGLMAGGVDIDLHDIVPVSDMSGVLQYLGSQDAGDIVILRLPESRNFMSSGEPRIIRAAELPEKFPQGFPAQLPPGAKAPR
jgi:hypothetical protein